MKIVTLVVSVFGFLLGVAQTAEGEEEKRLAEITTLPLLILSVVAYFAFLLSGLVAVIRVVVSDNSTVERSHRSLQSINSLSAVAFTTWAIGLLIGLKGSLLAGRQLVGRLQKV